MKIILLIVTIIFSSVAWAQQVNENISKGNRFYQMEKYEEAEAEYRNAIEADPKNTTAQFNLANALQKQKKYNEAIGVLDKISSSTKEKQLQSSVHYNTGVAYTKQKNLEQSIEFYKKALRITPDDKEARENLQKALQELKQKQQQDQQKQKQDPKMSQKEAEQKLKLLQQKEKALQEKLNDKNKQGGSGKQQDW